MIKDIQITVLAQTAGNIAALNLEIAGKLEVSVEDITAVKIKRKSIDARQRDIKVNLSLTVYLGEEPSVDSEFRPDYKDVTNSQPVIVVGSGPAGLFAALRLLERGLKPIVLERGREVSARKRDIAQISTRQLVDPESNYCFGEGGAGTFSDGKLYSRSNKRGSIERVLQIFHFHGADDNILYDAHPHIGTDKLPEIIKNIRQTILKFGGEVHFETKVTDILINNGEVRGVETADGKIFESSTVVLATGHSARDIYELLYQKEILLESKSFAMGVRVEHPQALIDSIQYHRPFRGPYLPAASYSLAAQVEGRGVYSFCMCPGGYIVPSATSADEMVVNGMSSSRRHTPFANSGIVVEIKPEDYAEFAEFGPLAGLRYQKKLEQMAKRNNNAGQVAPAQRLEDFVRGRVSSDLPESSYIPGLVSSPMHVWLPKSISSRLQQGFTLFNNKMRGFVTNQAYIAGVESRTSSPVRIPRDAETMQHPNLKGLFPCGEGAGYAGGIVSSAMDGENAVDRLVIR